MAREPVDLRTPGSRGLWVDRSPARMLSSPDHSTGDPPRRAARQGHLWARHEDAASAALPTHAAPDLAMPQGWSCLPAETTPALGRRFSQMVVRVLHGLRTSEGRGGLPGRGSSTQARRPICGGRRASLCARRVRRRYGAIRKGGSGPTPGSRARWPWAGRQRPSRPWTTTQAARAPVPCTGRALSSAWPTAVRARWASCWRWQPHAWRAPLPTGTASSRSGAFPARGEPTTGPSTIPVSPTTAYGWGGRARSRKRRASRCGVVSRRDAGIKPVAAPSCARGLWGRSRRRTARSIKTQTGTSKAVWRRSCACSRAGGWHAQSWSRGALRPCSSPPTWGEAPNTDGWGGKRPPCQRWCACSLIRPLRASTSPARMPRTLWRARPRRAKRNPNDGRLPSGPCASRPRSRPLSLGTRLSRSSRCCARMGLVWTVAGRPAQGRRGFRGWSSAAAVAAPWGSSPLPPVRNGPPPTRVSRRSLPKEGRRVRAGARTAWPSR